MPLIMIARLAFEAHDDREDERRPEHRDDVLGAEARPSCPSRAAGAGATASPGRRVDHVPLEHRHLRSSWRCVTGPEKPQGSGRPSTHPRRRQMPKERRERWQGLSTRPDGAQVRLVISRTRSATATSSRRCGSRRQRAEQPLELADPVAHRVVVEELQPRRLGHVEVRVEQHRRVSRRSAASVVSLGERPEHVAAANARSSSPSGTSAISRCTPSWSKNVVDPPPCTRRPTSTARRAWA